MVLWDADAEEFRPELRGWISLRLEKLRLPLMPGGAERCVGDIFAMVEFKCLLMTPIGRCELERDEKRGVVDKARLAAKLYVRIPISVTERGLGGTPLLIL